MLVTLLVALSSVRGHAEVFRTQEIALRAGWNAIHLQVKPERSDPNAVFGDTPVDIVTRYFTTLSSIQFITDPADQDWKKPGWGAWYAPHRPDSFLTSLFAIQGDQTYLVHSEREFVWRVTGKVVAPRVVWKVNSYNLAGFQVDSSAPPTFASFFSGARERIGRRIFRLENDTWKLVQDLASTSMRDGEACWIYCEGATEFQGALEVTTAGAGLAFGPGSIRQVVVRNRGARVVTVRMENLPAGGDLLALRLALPDLATLRTTHAPISAPVELEFQPGTAQALELHVREDDLTGSASALLRFTSSEGARVWLPAMTAPRP